MPVDPQQYYSMHAEDYAVKNSEESIPQALRQVRDDFLGCVDGDRVLDLGCGHGRETRFFADQGYEAIGIDVAAGMIEEAGRLTGEAVYTGRTTYMQGDMRDLPFKDEQFAGVWAAASIFILPNEEVPSAVQEVERVLADEGVFYAGVKMGDQPIENEDFGDTVRQYPLTEERVENILRDTGFTITETYGSVNNDGNGFMNYFCQH